jgi:hypothetical protein
MTFTMSRDESGVIVTLANRYSDERVTRFESGLVDDALSLLLDHFDVRHWRVVSISTPHTVLRDLRGRKSNAHKRKQSRTQAEGARRAQAVQPERTLLARIGRLGYLDTHNGGT